MTPLTANCEQAKRIFSALQVIHKMLKSGENGVTDFG
jgi:hypothetical protein